MLRIEASPDAKGRKKLLDAIKAKVKEVKACGGVARLEDDPIKHNANTIFIVQRSLRDFLESSIEDDQLTAIHDQLKAWSTALFSDGLVEKALEEMLLKN
jgi:hypothetical protein